MDIQREKPKGWKAIIRKKNIPYALAAVGVGVIVWLLLQDGEKVITSSYDNFGDNDVLILK